MLEVLVPKYSIVTVLRITETTDVPEIANYFKKYNKLVVRISKKDRGFVIKFTQTFQVTLTVGSLLFYDGTRFNYVLADDAPMFDEMFYNISDKMTLDVCKETSDGFMCKHCNFYYKEKFDVCPNCKTDANTLGNKINKMIAINSKLELRKVRKVKPVEVKQYQCPECNYISLTPFDVCPACSNTGTYSLEFTDVTKKLKTKRKSKMCTENTNNVQEVEEKEEETKVTAVYGDCVSVSNTEVQSNPSETTNNDKTSSHI
jgi:RNA polymerase subunit RPABC4/transcription elongation factor Spt4